MTAGASPPPLALPPGAKTLTLRRAGLLSRDRTLAAGEAVVARLHSDRWADGADLATADGAWRLARAGFLRRTLAIVARSTGETVGTGTPTGLLGLGRTTALTLDGRALALERPSAWRRRFALRDAQGTTLADIAPHRGDLDIALAGGASPFEIGVACWLVLAILRGEAAGASGAAAAAAVSSS